jgi:hypothetical protein
LIELAQAILNDALYGTSDERTALAVVGVTILMLCFGLWLVEPLADALLWKEEDYE